MFRLPGQAVSLVPFDVSLILRLIDADAQAVAKLDNCTAFANLSSNAMAQAFAQSNDAGVTLTAGSPAVSSWSRHHRRLAESV